jgi:DNA invertase Pin-like site-specific DNA recombinase
MSTSELITTAHLARKAIIYIRQSTPQQAISHQEGLRLQYALKQRALNLGWREEDVEIIDSDLGTTGASAEHREGFQALVAKVTLGHVGIILSFDVTRLARNCSDWYPLLDVCGYRGCLIGDNDGTYDPATANGRLLLGIKGQLSELELHTIRARMRAGLLNKARRGELAVRLPIGLARDELDQVVKHPDREIQARLELVFSTFLRLKSAHQVVRYFKEQSLLLPSRDRFGDLIWKRPASGAILNILKNPAYAGAFVFGRSQRSRDETGQTRYGRVPRDHWHVCVHDKYPAYISWQTFERIQEMLRKNYSRYDTEPSPGIPRAGAALLHGLVFCGKCGHQMRVHYKGHAFAYICDRLKARYQAPTCQRISGQPLDAAVVEAFFQALSPAELDVYEHALAQQAEADEQVDHARRQQLERLRYQAALAERQFNRVDPDNRLVAAELEKRWETALRELQQAEELYARQQQEQGESPSLPAELKEAFMAIGRKLPDIWDQGVLSPEKKKALLRCLIDKVVLDRDRPDRVQVRIVWQGGDTSSLSATLPVASFSELSTAVKMEELIQEMSRQGKSDEEVAECLTARGYRSPSCTDRVLPFTVRKIRRKHGIYLKHKGPNPLHVSGYLTIPQLSRLLDIPSSWFYYHIANGRLQVEKDIETDAYLFPDSPETLEQFRRFRAGDCESLQF